MRLLTYLVLFLVCQVANAGLLKFDIANPETTLNNEVEVSIIASEFGSFDTFNFDISFDKNIFAYNSASFNSTLNTTNPFAIFMVNESSTGLNFSFLDFSPVNSTDFVLGSFKLHSINIGETILNFKNVSFYQPFPFIGQLTIDATTTARLAVSNIPEPASYLLLLLGLLTITRTKIS